MRIAFILYGWLGQRSGGYLYDRQLVQHLRDAGDEVTAIGLPRRPYLLATLDNLSGLAARLARLAPDIVIEDELCHPSLFWENSRIAKRLCRPIVSIVHHLRVSERPHGRLEPAIERRYLETVDAVVANSMTTASTVGELLGRLPRSMVAPPGRDRLGTLPPAAVADRAGRTGPLRIITVGNLEPRKNLVTLIRALARLPRGAFHLTVVGGAADRRYAASLRRLVVALRLDGEVRFSGAVDDAELARLLAESDVYAQPSRYEGFGIAALEALGFGLPAVVSSAGGAVELVSHGEDGFVVQPDESGAIAEALSALADRKRLERMSLAALARYNRQPTWRESLAPVRDFLVALV